MKKIDVNFLEPPKQQLNSLLELYQTGRYVDAEKLSISITKEFPKHPFPWKVFGAILEQTGRINESLVVCQKSTQLDPQDAEAHNNLGNILKKLGRLEEAEASYTQAITLKPNLAEAHNNLGVLLKKLGRLKEAEASFRQAITLKPDFTKAHNNLGNTLKELGRLEEAETSYRQAIILKPDYAEAHINFGNTLKKLGRLEEAEASYRKAIASKPDYSEAKHLLAALIGKTTNSAPRKYVETLYNNYAMNFEHILVNKLEYKIPNLITKMIVAQNSNIQLGSVLDLGCGTGLIGDEIRKYCSNLEGIDLSKSMLEKASAKNIYDKLQHEDIVEYLSTKNLDFNYFISCDVFVYVGELSEIFKLIKSRNKSKGKFVFSTEHTDRDGFFLEKSGKYSHSKKYIESLCNEFGYKLSHFETANLRKEKDKFIIGGLYFLDF